MSTTPKPLPPQTPPRGPEPAPREAPPTTVDEKAAEMEAKGPTERERFLRSDAVAPEKKAALVDAVHGLAR